MNNTKPKFVAAAVLAMLLTGACGDISSGSGGGGYDCSTLARGCDKYDRLNESYESPAVKDFVDSVQADRDARMGN